jgi:hypothetical protein
MGVLQMCVPWQRMPIVETRRVDRATRNGGNNAARYQKRTATVCEAGLQTVQEMRWPTKAYN